MKKIKKILLMGAILGVFSFSAYFIAERQGLFTSVVNTNYVVLTCLSPYMVCTDPYNGNQFCASQCPGTTNDDYMIQQCTSMGNTWDYTAKTCRTTTTNTTIQCTNLNGVSFSFSGSSCPECKLEEKKCTGIDESSFCMLSTNTCAQCAPGKFNCNNTCIPSGQTCTAPQTDVCPSDKPIKCSSDNSCQATQAECPCASSLTKCSDGTCQSTCPTSGGTTQQTPQQICTSGGGTWNTTANSCQMPSTGGTTQQTSQQICTSSGGTWNTTANSCQMPSTGGTTQQTPQQICTSSGGTWNTTTNSCQMPSGGTTLTPQQQCAASNGIWNTTTGSCQTSSGTAITPQQQCSNSNGVWNSTNNTCTFPNIVTVPSTITSCPTGQKMCADPVNTSVKFCIKETDPCPTASTSGSDTSGYVPSGTTDGTPSASGTSGFTPYANQPTIPGLMCPYGTKECVDPQNTTRKMCFPSYQQCPYIQQFFTPVDGASGGEVMRPPCKLGMKECMDPQDKSLKVCFPFTQPCPYIAPAGTPIISKTPLSPENQLNPASGQSGLEGMLQKPEFNTENKAEIINYYDEQRKMMEEESRKIRDKCMNQEYLRQNYYVEQCREVTTYVRNRAKKSKVCQPNFAQMKMNCLNKVSNIGQMIQNSTMPPSSDNQEQTPLDNPKYNEPTNKDYAPGEKEPNTGEEKKPASYFSFLDESWKTATTDEWQAKRESLQEKSFVQFNSLFDQIKATQESSLLKGVPGGSGTSALPSSGSSKLTEKQKELEQNMEQVTKKMEELNTQLSKQFETIQQALQVREQKLVELREKNATQIAEAIKMEETINAKVEDLRQKLEVKEEQKAEILDRKKVRDLDNDLSKKIVAKMETETKDLMEKLKPTEKAELLLYGTFDQNIINLAAKLCDLRQATTEVLSGSCEPENFTNLIASIPDKKVEQVTQDYDLAIGLDAATAYTGAATVIDTLGLTGKNVKVAIVDTGIDADHPCFKGKNITTVDFTGEGTKDENGHGTHVAGIVGCIDELRRGNAPDSILYGVKVMKKDGSGKMSDAIAGINWAIEQKVNIMNISLGAKVAKCDGTDPLSQAVEKAVAAGIVVVTAAGNFGPDASTVAAPGCSASPITVGAVNTSGVTADFTSRGPTTDGRIKPDILSPGISVVSSWTGGKWAAVSGTSQAAPMIAGISALLLEAKPTLTPVEVKETLVVTADIPTEIGLNMDANQGIVNTYQAISQFSDITQKLIAKQATAVSNPSASKKTETKQTEDKKAATDTSNTNKNTKVVQSSEKEPTNFVENRAQLKGCNTEAKKDAELKKACSNKFIKYQLKIQKSKLPEAEKNKILALEKIAVEVNKQISREDISDEIKERLKLVSSVLYYTVYVNPQLEEVYGAADDLNANLPSATPEALQGYLSAFEKIYSQSKKDAIGAKYSRKIIPFQDVDDRSWYFSYVEDIKAKGLVSGYKDANGNDLGTFGPGNNLTVAEAIKITMELANLGQSTSEENPKNSAAINHWAKKYFKKAEELNLNIVANANDNPNRFITRAEVVRLVAEAKKIKIFSKFDASFSDVPASSSFAPYIYTASILGIVSGDSDSNTFRPNDLINRAEFAKIVIEVLDMGL